MGRIQLAGQIGGAVLHPGVLIHLAPEKAGAVGALFPDDLRFFNEGRVIDEDSAALAHGIVLRLMEGVAAKVADGAQCPALIKGVDALCGVLYHLQVVAAGDVHDGVHLAADAGVVDDADDLCLIGDGGFDLRLVNVHGVRTNIHKHRHRPHQHKGIGGGDKRVGRQDHLVSGFQIAQQSGQLQCVRAGGGEQHLRRPRLLLQQLVAPLGKRAVAAEFVIDQYCLSHIVQLFPRVGRHIERNHDRNLRSHSHCDFVADCRLSLPRRTSLTASAGITAPMAMTEITLPAVWPGWR